MSTESDMDDFAIRILQKYKVKITIDRDLQENHGYVFNPSTIYAPIQDCVLFNEAIEYMILALEHRPDYIRKFQ